MKKIITGVLSTCLLISALAVGFWQLRAQEPEQPTFRVKVDMVVLGFTVLDQKNKYVNGLKPKDFKIYEDDIQEKPATFAEGSRTPMQVTANGELRPLTKQQAAETASPLQSRRCRRLFRSHRHQRFRSL